jgi:intracellular septation protein
VSGKDMENAAREPAWLKPATDYVPLVVFLVVYFTTDILTATAAIIVASLAALAVSYLVARRVPMLPLLAAGLLAIFGGLTLFFEDDFFIKIKPTIVQILFAVAIYGSLKMGKPVLKLLIGSAFPMRESAWATLSLRYALFFLVMAALNEVVWRTQSTDFWVTFDTVGQMGISFAFILSQVPFMMANRIDEAEQNAD